LDRRDLVIAGIAGLVTVASWGAAIGYDAGQREADSYLEGQRWAERTAPTAAECENEMFRISGPQVIGGAWLDGCLASPATIR
jgi:hypothetical protein